jgi:PhnB protein
MKIDAYVFYDGNCEEAFQFYQSALGGELSINRYEGSPMESEVPAEAKDKVMHCSLVVDGATLMGADSVGAWRRQRGNNISLSLATSNEKEAESAFAKLSAGGNVTMPMTQQFWGAKFGMFTDRFGVDWMISCHNS